MTTDNSYSENRTEKNGNSGKVILAVLTALILVFLVYYGVMSALAPAKKLAELEALYQPEKPETGDFDERLFSDSAYLALIKEKAFLQSRIAMAQTDSICLTLNISDSTANLEISGVLVHSAKFTDIKVSRILTTGDEYVISSMLSVPLNIVADYSTIRKEPLMVKLAPKDTSEYLPDITPDTTDYEPVTYIMDTDRGIRIYVSQAEENERDDRSAIFFFDLSDRIKSASAALKKVVHFEVPDYHPFIKIRMPKSEAKIIYRAIPVNGQVTVFR